MALGWNPSVAHELMDAFESLDAVWDLPDPLGSPGAVLQQLEFKNEQLLDPAYVLQGQAQARAQGSTSGSDNSPALQDCSGPHPSGGSFGSAPQTGWADQLQQIQQQQQQYDPSQAHMQQQLYQGAWCDQQQHQQQGRTSNLSTVTTSGGGGAAGTGAKRVRAAPKGGAKAQLQELQAVVTDKQHQISRLVSDNARLRDRARVLVLVVKCRSEQVERLQQLAAAATGPPPASALPLAVATASAPLGAAPGATGEGATAGAAPATAAADADRHAASWTVRMNGKTLEDMMAEFRVTVTLLSEALLDAPGNSAPTARLIQIMDGWYQGIKYSILINPDVLRMTGSASATADTPTGETPDDAHWLSVAIGIDLLPEQAADCVLLRTLLTAWSHRLMLERSRLGAALAVAASTSEHTYGGGVLQAAGALGNEVQLDQLLMQLQKNVVQERCLLVLVGEVLFTKLLSVVQGARAVVHSHPYVPDAVAVLAGIANAYR